MEFQIVENQCHKYGSKKLFKMCDWYRDAPKTFEEMLAYAKYVYLDKKKILQKSNDSQLGIREKKKLNKIEKDSD